MERKLELSTGFVVGFYYHKAAIIKPRTFVSVKRPIRCLVFDPALLLLHPVQASNCLRP